MPILIFTLFLLLSGCSMDGSVDDSTAEREQHRAVIHLESPSAILFQGELFDSNVALFEQLLLAPSATVKTVIVDSGGGEINAGLRLGRLIKRHDLEVIVRGRCLSSCANYVLPASRSVVVEEGAVIGWHGGALDLYEPFEISWSDRLYQFFNPDAKRGMQTYMQTIQIDERDFFEWVEAEQAMTILGMHPTLAEQRTEPLFSYDIETLARLGLTIRFEGEPAVLSPSGEKIVHIFDLTQTQLQQLIDSHNQKVKSHQQSKTD